MSATAEPVGRVGTPWVTLILIGLNFVVSLLATLDPNLRLELAFEPGRPSLFTALASLFLHANTLHLLGNMVFLAAVGPRVESVAGRTAYGLIYVIGGAAGVLAHWVVSRAVGGTPLMGASGAIASCAGYCAVRFMSRRVPLAPKLSVTVGTVTLVWVALQAIGAFVKVGEQHSGGPAFWTHLVGFGAGLLLSLLFRAPQQARRQFGHDVLEQMTERGPAALAQAAERHLAEHPDDTKALNDLASAANQMGDREQESGALLRLLDLLPTPSQPNVLERLEACGALGALPAVRRLKLAETHKATRPDVSKRLSYSIDESDPLRPEALLALATLEEGEGRDAVTAELRERFALHPATEIARQKGLLR
ncbi:MAG: rhomboid family intramembrane serine protease [Armatimonadetes bacterium]|nr:rhomboid family intramembrane serine protease [Armatimonadota bacterium]